MMQFAVFIFSVLLLGLGQAAAAVKSCAELKDAIAAKLNSKSVTNYELMIVAADSDEAGGKIVGSCDDGSKKILYFKPAAQLEQEPRLVAAAVLPSGQEQAGGRQPVPVVTVNMIPAAIRSCEEVKAEIEGKLISKGVTGYKLTVAESGSAAAGKVVGSCENGSKQIFYLKK